NNTCLECSLGSRNEPGDDASGADTQCEDACFRAFGVFCADFEEAYVKASNTDEFDRFGSSVALDGDTLVVGAPLEDSSSVGVGGAQDDNDSPDSGAVYVFERNAQGVWSQRAYLKASNTDASDEFGDSVALDGDTLVVGAPNEDSSAVGVGGPQDDNSSLGSGAAYVFSRDAEGMWSQRAYLKATNTDEDDEFSSSIALSGDTLVISAPGESSSATGVNGMQDNDFSRQSGAAYIHRLTP
ncbi:MAG: FG-GAP repeat protein, partial [Myxococcota bacterium]